MVVKIPIFNWKNNMGPKTWAIFIPNFLSINAQFSVVAGCCVSPIALGLEPGFQQLQKHRDHNSSPNWPIVQRILGWFTWFYHPGKLTYNNRTWKKTTASGDSWLKNHIWKSHMLSVMLASMFVVSGGSLVWLVGDTIDPPSSLARDIALASLAGSRNCFPPTLGPGFGNLNWTNWLKKLTSPAPNLRCFLSILFPKPKKLAVSTLNRLRPFPKQLGSFTKHGFSQGLIEDSQRWCILDECQPRHQIIVECKLNPHFEVCPLMWLIHWGNITGVFCGQRILFFLTL